MISKLAVKGGTPTISSTNNHYVWPRITNSVKKAVATQLETTCSIYDRSGIFEEFENEFKKYHDKRYALVTNSGTSALFGIFEGLDLKPNDEVIFPAYTFFATASPIIYWGAIPIFCDCDQNGNLDPRKLQSILSSKTKALVITHMWGMPCNMDPIVDFVEKNNLALIEDCSHAHGAKYKKRKVGTFGIAAAWSLQGKKIITGGEGGILTTDSKNIYYRSLLQGQYNKRCKQEIPPTHKHYEFSTTGLGLKLRAHPLAIAIANEQFKHLDKWIIQKNIYANRIMEALSPYEFINLPKTSDLTPSWYALVFLFDVENKLDCTLSEFVTALHMEGLVEVDHPRSTRPIHNMPLFTKTREIMPRYPSDTKPKTTKHPNSEQFYNHAVKIPVWAFKDEEKIVNSYINGLVKVCIAVATKEL